MTTLGRFLPYELLQKGSLLRRQEVPTYGRLASAPVTRSTLPNPARC